MKDIVVEVNKLRKVYGDSVAVDNISFDVRKGEIFALLDLMALEKQPPWNVLKV